MDTSKSPETGPETKPQETEAPEKITEIIAAFAPYLPQIQELTKSAQRYAMARFSLGCAGGLTVLGLAFYAGSQREWALAEKLAIPALSFFAGMIAGGKK